MTSSARRRKKRLAEAKKMHRAGLRSDKLKNSAGLSSSRLNRRVALRTKLSAAKMKSVAKMMSKVIAIARSESGANGNNANGNNAFAKWNRLRTLAQ